MSAGFSAFSRALLAFACTIPERRFMTLIAWPFLVVGSLDPRCSNGLFRSCEHPVERFPGLFAVAGLVGQCLCEAVDPFGQRHGLGRNDDSAHGPVDHALYGTAFAGGLEDDPRPGSQVDGDPDGGLVALEHAALALYLDLFTESIGELGGEHLEEGVSVCSVGP